MNYINNYLAKDSVNMAAITLCKFNNEEKTARINLLLSNYINNTIADAIISEEREDEAAPTTFGFVCTSDGELVVRINSQYIRVKKRILFRLRNNIRAISESWKMLHRCNYAIATVNEKYSLITLKEYKRIGGDSSGIEVLLWGAEKEALRYVKEIGHSICDYRIRVALEKQSLLLVYKREFEQAKRSKYISKRSMY